jgi:hypothetical protein
VTFVEGWESKGIENDGVKVGKGYAILTNMVEQVCCWVQHCCFD